VPVRRLGCTARKSNRTLQSWITSYLAPCLHLEARLRKSFEILGSTLHLPADLHHHILLRLPTGILSPCKGCEWGTLRWRTLSGTIDGSVRDLRWHRASKARPTTTCNPLSPSSHNARHGEHTLDQSSHHYNVQPAFHTNPVNKIQTTQEKISMAHSI
jgi:hypothetical protein